jgi:hypothetical protein
MIISSNLEVFTIKASTKTAKSSKCITYDNIGTQSKAIDG